jgi:hypothetical protein
MHLEAAIVMKTITPLAKHHGHNGLLLALAVIAAGAVLVIEPPQRRPLAPHIVRPAATQIAPAKVLPSKLAVDAVVGYDQSVTAQVGTGARGFGIEDARTGRTVKRGAALATLVSPDVALAQRELVEVAKNFTTQEALDAVRRKLLRMGVPPDALARTEKTGIVDGKLPLWAWIGGTVVDSKLVRGLYVEAGTQLVTITDPTRRWVLAEVDETDRISVGMAARLVVDGKPIVATVAAVYRRRYVRFDLAKPLPIDTPVRVEIDFTRS